MDGGAGSIEWPSSQRARSVGRDDPPMKRPGTIASGQGSARPARCLVSVARLARLHDPHGVVGRPEAAVPIAGQVLADQLAQRLGRPVGYPPRIVDRLSRPVSGFPEFPIVRTRLAQLTESGCLATLMPLTVERKSIGIAITLIGVCHVSIV